MKRVVLIILGFAILFTGCSKKKNAEAELLISQVEPLLMQSQYDEAIDKLSNAINLFSDSEKKAKAYINRADIYAYIGVSQRNPEFNEKAIMDYESAIQEARGDSIRVAATHKRARLYHGTGKYELADNDYNSAIEIYTDNSKKAIAYYEKSKALLANNLPDIAINNLIEAEKLATDSDFKGDILSQIASVYDVLGEFTKSQNAYGKAISTYIDDEKRGLVYYDIALSYENRKDNVKARENYDIASKMCKNEGNLSDIYNNLGVMSFSEKNYQSALVNFKFANENSKNNSRFLLNLALAHLYLNDQNKAILTIEKAISIDNEIAIIVSSSDEIRAYAMSLPVKEGQELENKLNEVLSKVKIPDAVLKTDSLSKKDVVKDSIPS